MTRSILAILVACALAATEVEGGEQAGPVYQRGRQGESRGGWGHGGGGRPGYGGYYGYGGYFSPPVVTGSWYARPYPYHFDYYRWRYSAPPQTPCPCEIPAQPSLIDSAPVFPEPLAQ